MDEMKGIIPGSEMDDQELDAVAGGRDRKSERKQECQRCRGEFPATSLLGGYCSSCLDELHKMGVFPPI